MRRIGPIVGWLGGWGIIAADVIVMANLAQIAGGYSFTFVGDLGWHSAAGLADSTLWSTVAGVIWITVMTYICYRGIEVSARLQYALLSIEIVVLVVLSIVALIKVYTHHAEDYSLLPSLSWFWPGGLDFGTVIAPAVLTTIFNLLTALIGSVGLMIALYYGLTGFTCVWFYRKTLTSSPRDFVMRGVVPLFGGVVLLVVFVYGLIQYAKPDWLTDDNGNNVTIFDYGAVAVVGIGALILGVIVMVVWRVAAPGFFKGLTLPRRSADQLLAPASTPQIRPGEELAEASD